MHVATKCKVLALGTNWHHFRFRRKSLRSFVMRRSPHEELRNYPVTHQGHKSSLYHHSQQLGSTITRNTSGMRLSKTKKLPPNNYQNLRKNITVLTLASVEPTVNIGPSLCTSHSAVTVATFPLKAIASAGPPSSERLHFWDKP